MLNDVHGKQKIKRFYNYLYGMGFGMAAAAACLAAASNWAQGEKGVGLGAEEYIL